MASIGKLNQVFLVIFIVTCSMTYSNVEARESVFFSKVNPVRRYSQLISSSMQALAPLASIEATPTPAPAPAPTLVLSETEPTSENYVYGFYNREVGEFPMATTKEEANAIKKKLHADDEFMNNDSGFGSEVTDMRDRKFANYENDYTINDNKEANRYPDFQKRYRSNNNNVQDYKYRTRRSYDDNNDDNMYTTNYDDNEDNKNERYTDENQYYMDKFELTKQRTTGRDRFFNNERYYNDNVEGYYRGNQRVRQYNPTEEHEGVYQP